VVDQVRIMVIKIGLNLIKCNFDDLIPEAYKPSLSYHHKKVAEEKPEK